MIVILFRSRLSGEAGEEYAETADRMLALARAMPGFISFQRFTAEDGERLSVIEFDSAEHLAAWREHPEHRRAQARGREKFYTEYRLTVAETVRDYGFKRDGAGG
jgi:heme-degrading monooxygenase HmoA